ncbi:hypothetical protein A3D85_01255 [Candidatus Amesbacteria bacterium RIFCSPHIGHO2_02_FULL_47_9]|uniref:Major facilitator superfamily (MFS) profile domain-containing protein n=1 Tax=Candidatus Amesbacteria bacterium RIFCSPHIGHO2_01_FULL_48_32b TaxID=1797253 RepID=A0A1F4YFL5_9BACT|nr:MAG: hypothetical protein A2876_03495 [Candidatus Amesbacteria bacterium RIFCSPHIGHO2_01_FULL_48_32b]OGD02227.1 MAG: hypothetical protein A3D85_01255 [Candidatus Amesbacteria bacterium RIFCSPHIGHO2_02_FULL_47_9]OGD08374.1 MAG: hypothetical protein A2899_01405 [Candidatus Amesbacteria bacterium RIFCSPLOWO2_01_FULL_49_25]
MNPQFKYLFRNRNFVKLWLSQILSQLTINIMTFYVLTQIYTVTQSTIAVSLIWIASALPALIFGPFSGALVDSFSRRKLLILTNTAQAVVIFLALFISSSRVFSLYVIVFLYWLIDQLYLPSQQASVPATVDRKFLASANGLFLLTQQASLLVGFGLGGILLSILGSKLTIILASINLAVAAIATYYLPQDLPPRRSTAEKNFLRFWQDFLVGYRFLKNHHLVLFPILMVILTQIFSAIISIILPSYTHDVLRLDLNHAGIILIVPGALGALAVTSSLPRLLKTKRKKDIMQAGLFSAGISLLVMASLTWIPSLFIKVFLSLLVAIGVGASFAAIAVPAQTLIQQHTPPWFRGRVYAHMSFLLILATTLPLFIFATIADSLGVATMIAIIGALLVGTYLYLRRHADLIIIDAVNGA